MKYCVVLLAVKDMKKSIAFYHEFLGMNVTEDLGANVTLDNCIALQTMETWSEFIRTPKEKISTCANGGEIYFESDDIDSFVEKLSHSNIEYVHRLSEHTWGTACSKIQGP